MIEIKYTKGEPTKELQKEIRTHLEGATIYWSDGRNCHWTSDTKLSNGQFLEVVTINNELDKFLVHSL